MTLSERIRICRLLEEMKKHKDKSKELGLKNESILLKRKPVTAQ